MEAILTKKIFLFVSSHFFLLKAEYLSPSTYHQKMYHPILFHCDLCERKGGKGGNQECLLHLFIFTRSNTIRTQRSVVSGGTVVGGSAEREQGRAKADSECRPLLY